MISKKLFSLLIRLLNYSSKFLKFGTAVFFISQSVNIWACEVAAVLSKVGNGVNITQNPCRQLEELGLNSQIQLSPNARLWLQEYSLNESQNKIRMICQNNGRDLIILKVSSPLAPWISILEYPECTDWSNNRLTCLDSATKQPVFLCAMVVAKNGVSNSMVMQTTSVKMRSVASLQHSNSRVLLEQKLNKVKQDVELCLQLSKQEPVSWELKTIVPKKSIKVVFKNSINGFTENCLSEVMSTLPQGWYLSIINP